MFQEMYTSLVISFNLIMRKNKYKYNGKMLKTKELIENLSLNKLNM